MRSARLEEMKGGWFVGDFEPSAMRTALFEAALKTYRAGESEQHHVHLEATEITLVVSGEVTMAGGQWTSGDIIVLDAGEPSSFRAETDAVLMVLKSPSVQGDKVVLPNSPTASEHERDA